MTNLYPALDLSTIKALPFPENQFYKVETAKKQICLHHTASGKGIDGDFKHWLNDPARVATAMIVGYDGSLNKCFDSKYWGHHLGIKPHVFSDNDVDNDNESLNKLCIGIEIDAWGPLVEHDGVYKSYVGTGVPDHEVQEYDQPFKAYPDSPFFRQVGVVGKPCFHYHKYSPEQIRATAQLLLLWCKGYGIPTTYNYNMWQVSRQALMGEPGIWTHVSYRNDKNDCHPQPELIGMLKSLSN